MFLGGVIFEAHTLSGYDEFINLPADSSWPGVVGADFEGRSPTKQRRFHGCMHSSFCRRALHFFVSVSTVSFNGS
jgi:hypothetical protein